MIKLSLPVFKRLVSLTLKIKFCDVTTNGYSAILEGGARVEYHHTSQNFYLLTKGRPKMLWKNLARFDESKRLPFDFNKWRTELENSLS